MRTAKEIRALQKQTIIGKYGPGKHALLECALCGHLRWNGTEHGVESDVVVTESNSDTCPICIEVIRRAPEVWNFVAGCIAKQRMLLEEGADLTSVVTETVKTVTASMRMLEQIKLDVAILRDMKFSSTKEI